MTYLSAKMPGYNNKFDHLLLKVSVKDSNWIIDVGSDGVLLEPLKLETGTILNTSSGIYRIDVNEKEHKLLKEYNLNFELEYTFYLGL